jgi:hypothetical protein
MDNLEHHFFVRGDTSEIVKQYTRECVTQLLQEYPDLTGMGLTLGEGMGGMTPTQREAWMKATIIEGMRLARLGYLDDALSDRLFARFRAFQRKEQTRGDASLRDQVGFDDTNPITPRTAWRPVRRAPAGRAGRLSSCQSS